MLIPLVMFRNGHIAFIGGIMTDKQIMIDGVKYNPCNDCELWNGHHCIGARSYEPNANEHKAICNEHMAKQFYKVYQQLYRKTQECEKLKEEISKLQLNEYHYKNELKKYKKGIHKYRNLLKYEINNLRLSRREFLKMVGRYPKFEKDNIKLALDTFNRKLELIDNPSHYRKALDEIDEYIYTDCEYNDGCDRHICIRCNYSNVHDKRILDIINKAKGEEKCQ